MARQDVRTDVGIGILFSKTEKKPSCPEDDMVKCVNGTLAEDGTTSCADVCGKGCCVGKQACDYFTGAVCKDGVSCRGDYACYAASINSIIRACNGMAACAYAAGNDGAITKIEDSCYGEDACEGAAAVNGSIGEIKDSCFGENACFFAASNYGDIGDIKDSCFRESACEKAASKYGSIGEIQDSCYGDNACYKASSGFGNITSISHACNAVGACYKAAYYESQGRPPNPDNGTTIAPGIQNCCNEELFCAEVTADTLPATCGPKSKKRKKSKSSKGTKNPMDGVAKNIFEGEPAELEEVAGASVNLDEDSPSHLDNEEFSVDSVEIGSMPN